jgi:hypothetical protein
LFRDSEGKVCATTHSHFLRHKEEQGGAAEEDGREKNPLNRIYKEVQKFVEAHEGDIPQWMVLLLSMKELCRFSSYGVPDEYNEVIFQVLAVPDHHHHHVLFEQLGNTNNVTMEETKTILLRGSVPERFRSKKGLTDTVLPVCGMHILATSAPSGKVVMLTCERYEWRQTMCLSSPPEYPLLNYAFRLKPHCLRLLKPDDPQAQEQKTEILIPRRCIPKSWSERVNQLFALACAVQKTEQIVVSDKKCCCPVPPTVILWLRDRLLIHPTMEEADAVRTRFHDHLKRKGIGASVMTRMIAKHRLFVDLCLRLWMAAAPWHRQHVTNAVAQKMDSLMMPPCSHNKNRVPVAAPPTTTTTAVQIHKRQS